MAAMWRFVVESPAVLAMLSTGVVTWAVVTLVRSPIEHGRRTGTPRRASSPPRH